IETRFTEGFYERELLSFDPKRDFLKPETDVSCIPKVMQEKTAGTSFERLDVEFAFLRNPDEKELKIIDKKIKDAVLILKTVPSTLRKQLPRYKMLLNIGKEKI
ncbi:MAG: hypothetical protein ACN6PN_25640, partial [Sphingobacterium sp.]